MMLYGIAAFYTAFALVMAAAWQGLEMQADHDHDWRYTASAVALIALWPISFAFLPKMKRDMARWEEEKRRNRDS